MIKSIWTSLDSWRRKTLVGSIINSDSCNAKPQKEVATQPDAAVTSAQTNDAQWLQPREKCQSLSTRFSGENGQSRIRIITNKIRLRDDKMSKNTREAARCGFKCEGIFIKFKLVGWDLVRLRKSVELFLSRKLSKSKVHWRRQRQTDPERNQIFAPNQFFIALRLFLLSWARAKLEGSSIYFFLLPFVSSKASLKFNVLTLIKASRSLCFE